MAQVFEERKVVPNPCIINVHFFQKEALGNPADTSIPGAFGMLCMDMAFLGSPFNYIVVRGQYVGFSERIIHRWMHNVVAGLEHLHSSGVLHRDLKPDNLLLDVSGMCMLCDFGWARGFEDKGAVNLTARPGSLEYRAPEGEGSDYDSKIDIWALAATLKVLITAKPTGIVPTFKQNQVDVELERSSKEGNWSKGFLRIMVNMFTCDPKKRWSLDKIKRDRSW